MADDDLTVERFRRLFQEHERALTAETTQAYRRRRALASWCPLCGDLPVVVDVSRDHQGQDPDAILVDCARCQLRLDLTTWRRFRMHCRHALLDGLYRVSNDQSPKQGAENAPGEYRRQMTAALQRAGLLRGLLDVHDFDF